MIKVYSYVKYTSYLGFLQSIIIFYYHIIAVDNGILKLIFASNLFKSDYFGNLAAPISV